MPGIAEIEFNSKTVSGILWGVSASSKWWAGVPVNLADADELRFNGGLLVRFEG